MLKIAYIVLADIYSHAEETFPKECCGFLSSNSLDGIVTQALKCTNIQDGLHKQDPKTYPRTARTAYCINPTEMIDIFDRDKQDYYILGVYHSHNDVVARFSNIDKKRAIMGKEPVFPKAHYLVVSVIKGKARYVKSFRWNVEQKDFVEEEVEVVYGDF